MTKVHFHDSVWCNKLVGCSSSISSVVILTYYVYYIRYHKIILHVRRWQIYILFIKRLEGFIENIYFLVRQSNKKGLLNVVKNLLALLYG